MHKVTRISLIGCSKYLLEPGKNEKKIKENLNFFITIISYFYRRLYDLIETIQTQHQTSESKNADLETEKNVGLCCTKNSRGISNN